MDNQNNRNKQNLPGNNNPNNKNNRQRWNIILFTVMLISFIVFALYQFREDTDAREITYDQFLNMVDSGEVKKVVIEDDKIVITAKTEAEMKNSKKKGASESDVVEGSVADNNDSSSKDSSDDSTGLFSNVTRKQYYTGIVKDDTLSDRLYKAGVEYEQKIPDSTSYMVMNQHCSACDHDRSGCDADAPYDKGWRHDGRWKEQCQDVCGKIYRSHI